MNTTSAMTTVLIAGATLVYGYMSGMFDGSAKSTESDIQDNKRNPVHLAVVCDASDSGYDLTCTKETLAIALNAWLSNYLNRKGSTFTAIQAGNSRDSAQELISLQVPGAWGGRVSSAKARFVTNARAMLKEITFNDPGSSLAETIQIAANRLNEKTGARQLLVMSDMRQVTRSVWNFERRVPSAKRFVDWLQRNSLIADLRQIDLTICGLHNRRAPNGPKHTARREQRIRDAWPAAFREMGATDVPLLSTCDSATLVERISGRR